MRRTLRSDEPSRVSETNQSSWGRNLHGSPWCFIKAEKQKMPLTFTRRHGCTNCTMSSLLFALSDVSSQLHYGVEGDFLEVAERRSHGFQVLCARGC
jgi:hypothetical protein